METELKQRLVLEDGQSDNTTVDMPGYHGKSNKRRNIGLSVLAGCLAMAALFGTLAGTGQFSRSSSSSSPSSAPYPDSSASRFELFPGSFRDLNRCGYFQNDDGTVNATLKAEADLPGNTYTKLHYNVTLAHNIIAADLYNEISHVYVTNQSVTIFFKSPQDVASWVSKVDGGLLYIRPEFGYGTVIRRVVSINSVNVDNIVVGTSKAAYTDLFRHAKVSYFSNATVAHNSHWQYKTHHRRGFFDDVGNFFNSIVQNVGGLATIAKDVVTTAFTGSFSFDQTLASNTWNLDQYCFSSADPSLSLSCSASMGYSVALELEIQDYSLQVFQPTITLSPYFSTSMNSVLTPSYQDSGNDQVASDSFPIAGFNLGPINIGIDFTFTLQDQFNIQANANVQAQESVTISGDVVLGMSYTPSNGFQWIYQPNINANAPALSYNTNDQASAVLTLAPSFGLSISELGGVSAAMSLSAYTGVTADASSQQTTGCELNVAAQVDVQIALSGQMSLGNLIDDPSLNKNWGPSIVYQNDIPITTTCLIQ